MGKQRVGLLRCRWRPGRPVQHGSRTMPRKASKRSPTATEAQRQILSDQPRTTCTSAPTEH
eukprot:scaffold455301_cov48-Prasinocladus_malaysianus.AAC.1